MSFAVLFERLTEQIRLRVRNGDVTERGLARLAGLSQPHVHNVLKGARAMSPNSADRLMKALGLSARELVTQSEPASPCDSCGYRSPERLKHVRAPEPLRDRSPAPRPPSCSN